MSKRRNRARIEPGEPPIGLLIRLCPTFYRLSFETTSFINFLSSHTGTLVIITNSPFQAITVVGFLLICVHVSKVTVKTSVWARDVPDTVLVTFRSDRTPGSNVAMRWPHFVEH